jgi:hypothetical protein
MFEVSRDGTRFIIVTADREQGGYHAAPKA